MKSGATPAADKVILKLAGIACFNNEAAAKSPNNTSINCPRAEIRSPTVVSLASNSLSWDHTFLSPFTRCGLTPPPTLGSSKELKILWSMVFLQIKGEVVCQTLKMNWLRFASCYLGRCPFHPGLMQDFWVSDVFGQSLDIRVSGSQLAPVISAQGLGPNSPLRYLCMGFGGAL